METAFQNSLSIDSTLDELPSSDSNVSFDAKGDSVLRLFNDNPQNPGVIIIREKQILGVISREAFFEKTGRRFGVEIFLGRPIHLMLEDYPFQPLVMPASTKISAAAFTALKRKQREVFEPIIVEKANQVFHLIDILTIFLAENQILLTLHNQHAFTVASGIQLSDREAIIRFVKFAGITKPFDTNILRKRNAINCDHCGGKFEYSITDVIRSHPQLERGIEISTSMGNRSYLFYVKHTCGKEIREIPVYYDGEFNLRALRPSRLVETYV